MYLLLTFVTNVLIVCNVTACELLLAVGVVDVRWSGRVMRLGNVRNTPKKSLFEKSQN